MLSWLRGAVRTLPGSPFFHLRALTSLPRSHTLIWLEALASTLGRIQQQFGPHPRQFHRFNDMLDVLAADSHLRGHLIARVRDPNPIQHRLPAQDAFMALAVYLCHPYPVLHPGVHRLLVSLCHQQGYDPVHLARWYERHGIQTQLYREDCQRIGAHWLDDYETLRQAYRKFRSTAHPDRKGSTDTFLQAEHIAERLEL